jgi:hypothetical protein
MARYRFIIYKTSGHQHEKESHTLRKQYLLLAPKEELYINIIGLN